MLNTDLFAKAISIFFNFTEWYKKQEKPLTTAAPSYCIIPFTGTYLIEVYKNIFILIFIGQFL